MTSLPSLAPYSSTVQADQSASPWIPFYPSLLGLAPANESAGEKSSPMNCSQHFVLVLLDSSEKGAQGVADDLPGFVPGQFSQFLQNRLVFVRQVDCGRTGGLAFGPQSQPPVWTSRPTFATRRPIANCNQIAISPLSVGCKDFVKWSIPYEKRVEFADFLRDLVRRGWFVQVFENGLWRPILDYLAWAESVEENVWLQTDIRIAYVTVALASRGIPQPHLAASYQVLGLHPEKVWPSIEERRRALLGSEYSKFVVASPSEQPNATALGGSSNASLPPKKSPKSVTPERKEDVA